MGPRVISSNTLWHCRRHHWINWQPHLGLPPNIDGPSKEIWVKNSLGKNYGSKLVIIYSAIQIPEDILFDRAPMICPTGTLCLRLPIDQPSLWGKLEDGHLMVILWINETTLAYYRPCWEEIKCMSRYICMIIIRSTLVDTNRRLWRDEIEGQAIDKLI